MITFTTSTAQAFGTPWQPSPTPPLQAADACGDIFLSAAGRIDHCMCLTLGGAGWVGTKRAGKPAQVRRDMRSADFASRYHVARAEAHQLKVAAPTKGLTKKLDELETERMLAGIRPSLIDEGDTVLVEHWEVSRVWKEAMGCCADLASFGHECYAHGESSGVDIVKDFLEHSRQLQHGQYVSVAVCISAAEALQRRGALFGEIWRGGFEVLRGGASEALCESLEAPCGSFETNAEHVCGRERSARRQPSGTRTDQVAVADPGMETIGSAGGSGAQR